MLDNSLPNMKIRPTNNYQLLITSYHRTFGISTLVERALQIHPFLTNKANFQKSQMNLTNLLTKDYGKIDTWSIRKNEPKTNPKRTQFKANSNPKQTQYEAEQSQFRDSSRARFVYSAYSLTGFVMFTTQLYHSILPKWHYIRIIENTKKAVKKFNFLKYKKLNSPGSLRPLTGTLFAQYNVGITILTNS